MRLLSPLVHLFYPHTCDGCGRDLVRTENILCLRCLRRLPATGFQQWDSNPVARIFWGRVSICHAMAAYYFTRASVLQRLIHQFKYHHRRDIALHLGRQTGRQLLLSEWLYEIDCIVPVPLHPAKERHRGYNQAAVLAGGIAEIVGKPVLPHAMRRTAYADSQTRKGRVSRWENVAGAFTVKEPASLQGRHVLLVDDVITTGATSEACSQAIIDVQASVSFCALAFANN